MKTSFNFEPTKMINGYIFDSEKDASIAFNMLKRYAVEHATPNRQNAFKFPEIEDVIFNDPATIVFWSDGTKTVVKCQEDDEWDPEKGLAMAISKKALGNKGNFNNEFFYWLDE